MFYKFPEITNISDVLPAIEGSPEFIVANRGDHTVINYVVSTPDTFPPVVTVNDALRRECRGIVFDNATGNIIRRPLHKFFNANQTDETQVNKIDFDSPHSIYEKLDGSFIAPYRTSLGRLYIGTKMGNTDVATAAEQFVLARSNYLQLIDNLIEANYTPIFEWCTRKQRIVIDHPEDRLVLLAVRHMITGDYLNLEQIAPRLVL